MFNFEINYLKLIILRAEQNTTGRRHPFQLSRERDLTISREQTSFSTGWRLIEQFAKRHCNCTLGELFQEQAGLVLEKSRQKHSHLLVKDCYR